jgi:hypothetical protein
MRQACRRGASADFWLKRANCSNLPTAQERIDCRAEALDELEDALDECDEQQAARLDLCARLGGGIYAPEIDPGLFVEAIDNPFLPLLPGTTFIFEKVTPDGIERLEKIVTHQTEEILGVACTVVHDIESFEGEVVEDTFDWFAQDVAGNVWYFGEFTTEFEGGLPVSTSGSWRAGEDFAKPGIVMLAAPQVGVTYRQEFFLGEAEDAGAVIGLGAMVSVPAGEFGGCVQTEDFSPLEPGHLEHKFYAFGVGLVLELNPESGSRTELIEFGSH